MKPTEQVDRQALLKEIFSAFRIHFEARMNGELRRDVDPAYTGRIDVDVVLNALELAKEFLARHFDCREEMLFARAAPVAGTSWATMSRQMHGWKMLEYLLDFSISHGAIPVMVGIASEPAFRAGEKFELLLGAESEMATGKDVTRDLLKLLDTKCRVKVLVYEARVKLGWTKKVKEAIEAVFNAHASDPMKDIWLIVGVPRYSRWHEYEAKRAETPRKVFFLEKQGKSHVLVDKTQELWSLSLNK